MIAMARRRERPGHADQHDLAAGEDLAGALRLWTALARQIDSCLGNALADGKGHSDAPQGRSGRLSRKAARVQLSADFHLFFDGFAARHRDETKSPAA